jgi:hypothetical protein
LRALNITAPGETIRKRAQTSALKLGKQRFIIVLLHGASAHLLGIQCDYFQIQLLGVHGQPSIVNNIEEFLPIFGHGVFDLELICSCFGGPIR